MAYDLLLGKTKRDWSRSSNTANTTGYDPYARSLFNRRSEFESEPVVIVQKPARIGWFGATMGLMFGTRLLSGKWPWYWAGLAAKKLESPSHHTKG